MIVLVTEHSPETGSVWPILDLTEPISKGLSLPLQKMLFKALISSGSPTLVPEK